MPANTFTISGWWETTRPNLPADANGVDHLHLTITDEGKSHEIKIPVYLAHQIATALATLFQHRISRYTQELTINRLIWGLINTLRPPCPCEYDGRGECTCG